MHIHNLFTILLLALFAGFASCEKQTDPEVGWQEGVIFFSGDPAADGCGWLLLSEGKTFALEHLPEAFQTDPVDVWFTGEHTGKFFSCGLLGDRYPVMALDEIKLKPWKVRFLKEEPGRETSLDSFSLDSVLVKGDSIHLLVGYSGGCAIHQFNLWVLENGPDGEEIHLMPEHISNQDMCEAYLHQWLVFSLEPLQQDDRGSVSFWLRGSPHMSMLFGPYTYRYD